MAEAALTTARELRLSLDSGVKSDEMLALVDAAVLTELLLCGLLLPLPLPTAALPCLEEDDDDDGLARTPLLASLCGGPTLA